MTDLLPDTFRSRDVELDGVRIHAVVGGDGPPVLLLHGYPQTHAMWHLVAPALARDHTVVLADLRGYGDSGKPAASPENYAKREMARDQVALMALLGFERFALVGHDRGARVAHRLALDSPAAVERVAFLDIVPTLHVFEHVDRAVASAHMHWFFLSRPGGLPERLIGGDPEFWLRSFLTSLRSSSRPFDPAAYAEYVRCFSDPATIAATCADYRAAATIDLDHDAASRAAGEQVRCPTLVLWGEHGVVGKNNDVLAVWRRFATDVAGEALPAGHFLAEETPEETVAALREFLS
ncbi:MAG TPA: alpha/beta hydrolase [Pseudonocardiaceae bacterium]|nr:alpha/beta hydrolase [Pseudonocardiaceae bacterium]